MDGDSQRNLVSSDRQTVPEVPQYDRKFEPPSDQSRTDKPTTDKPPTDDPPSEGPPTDKPDYNPPAGRGWRFWAIFISLSVSAFLSTLEGAIVSTALPSISRAVNAGENYIWMVNVFFLTRY